MFGWCSTAAAAASVRKRWTNSGVANAPARIIFTATMRSRLTCRALYTTPMPPRAISSSNS